MKRIWICSLTLAAALTAGSAMASIINSMSANSSTGIGGISAWPVASFGAPTIVNGSAPNQFPTSENNYGGSSLYSLAQSFTVPIGGGGTLRDIQIAVSGTAPVTFNVAIYDALALAVGDTPGAIAYTVGGTVSNNLLTNNLSQTWGGFTVQGATAGVLDFSFTGADAITLQDGKSYIFEISSTSNPSGMVWFRGGATPVYTGGQAFRQRGSINGNPLREMSLGVTIVPAVPEPTTLGLGGAAVAVMVLGSRLRRRTGR